jgi:hypothetical protein
VRDAISRALCGARTSGNPWKSTRLIPTLLPTISSRAIERWTASETCVLCHLDGCSQHFLNELSWRGCARSSNITHDRTSGTQLQRNPRSRTRIQQVPRCCPTTTSTQRCCQHGPNLRLAGARFASNHALQPGVDSQWRLPEHWLVVAGRRHAAIADSGRRVFFLGLISRRDGFGAARP